MLSWDEAQLCELLVELDERADQRTLAELYDEFAPGIYGWALTRAPEPSAQRIVIDTFVRLWQHCRHRPERLRSSPWAWVTWHTLRAARAEAVRESARVRSDAMSRSPG